MNDIKEIGGYFELELTKGSHLYPSALRLNSAKNCFEYILHVRKYTKVYMPYYTCKSVFLPLEKLHIPFERYHIDENLEPTCLPTLMENEAFLYTNYFGLKQDCVERLSKIYKNHLIVDNAQALFSHSLDGIDTYYSPRKYVGVPDGGYLCTNAISDYETLTQDQSWNNMSFLLKRLDGGAQFGYEDFHANGQELNEHSVMKMSNVTDAILRSINFEKIRLKRVANFNYLQSRLYNNSFCPAHQNLGGGGIVFLWCIHTLQMTLHLEKN